MSNEAKTEYLNSIREEYQKSDRRQKGLILSHAELVTRLTRKTIIRRLSRAEKPTGAARRGRRPRYGQDPGVLTHLKSIWRLMEQACGKRLKVLLPRVMPSYRRRHPELSDAGVRELLQMSPATLDRLLRAFRTQRGVCTTKPPTSAWYKSAVPVQPKDWNITAPGYAQADTVSHCGENGAGAFASTLTVTDVDSHWTEMRASLTKQHGQIIRAIRDVEKSLPFPLETIKFDSGSEFMNYDVVGFCRGWGESYGRQKPIQVVRSRPYRKNDNCYVEQKNLTHVRQLVGYDRIESRRAVEILEDLYKNAWCPFLNFFMPSFKLLRKERIGSRIKKSYETPKTPYERLLESDAVSDERKQELRQRYESLDPFELKEQVEQKLKLLFEAIRNESKPDDALNYAA